MYRFSTIDQANSTGVKSTLPRHGFIISEPYPVVSDSLEKGIQRRCDTPADMLGRIDELIRLLLALKQNTFFCGKVISVSVQRVVRVGKSQI